MKVCDAEQSGSRSRRARARSRTRTRRRLINNQRYQRVRKAEAEPFAIVCNQINLCYDFSRTNRRPPDPSEAVTWPTPLGPASAAPVTRVRRLNACGRVAVGSNSPDLVLTCGLLPGGQGSLV